MSRRGFTLIEILIAMSLLGLITALLFTSFYSVNRTWEAGREVIDATGHSQYLMDQLTMALRSAYFPTTAATADEYGFYHTDDGDGEGARDIIEWTKTGPALIGEDATFANVPHRVRVYLTDADHDLPGGITVRAWRQDLQLDDFDKEVDTSELLLSPKVVGFNCRMLDPDAPKTNDGELNWIDDWTKTNTLPSAIELTLYMKPPKDADAPIESKRIVELPLAALSQNPSAATSDSSTNVRNQGGSAMRPSGGNRPNNGQNGGNRPGGNGQNGGNRPGGNGPPGGNPPGDQGPNGGGGGGGRPGNPDGIFIPR